MKAARETGGAATVLHKEQKFYWKERVNVDLTIALHEDTGALEVTALNTDTLNWSPRLLIDKEKLFSRLHKSEVDKKVKEIIQDFRRRRKQVQPISEVMEEVNRKLAVNYILIRLEVQVDRDSFRIVLNQLDKNEDIFDLLLENKSESIVREKFVQDVASIAGSGLPPIAPTRKKGIKSISFSFGGASDNVESDSTRRNKTLSFRSSFASEDSGSFTEKVEVAVNRVVGIFTRAKSAVMDSENEDAVATEHAPSSRRSSFRASFESTISNGSIAGEVSVVQSSSSDNRALRFSRESRNTMESISSVETAETVGRRLDKHIGQSSSCTQSLLATLPLFDDALFESDMSLKEYFSSLEYICSGSHADVFSGFGEGVGGSSAPVGETSRSGWFSSRKSAEENNFVVKKMKTSSVNSDYAVREFEREKTCLSRIRHTNIINLFGYGTCEDSNVPFLVLEKLRGTLSDVLVAYRPFNSRPLSYRKFTTAACEFAAALKYLHSELPNNVTVIHRDLKPDNIGFSYSGTLKLIDFGLCIPITRSSNANDVYTLTGCTGSLRYMAKEVFLGSKYNEKVDMYSFGLILYEMATGVTPFKGFSKKQFRELVVDNSFRPPLDSDEYARKIKLPESVLSLIENCWSEDCLDRPSATFAFDLLAKERDVAVASSGTFVGYVSGVLFGNNY